MPGTVLFALGAAAVVSVTIVGILVVHCRHLIKRGDDGTHPTA